MAIKLYCWRAAIKATRPPFLLLTPICVFLGWAAVIADGSHIDVLHLVLILACALLAHISVNSLNEYQDFKSGLDEKTVRTPFSGGSGALVECPAALELVRFLAYASLLLAVMIGTYFALQLGPVVLPIGALGVLIILSYTQFLNRLPWLCLLAPGVAFGLLMVNGSYLVFSGGYSQQTLCLSLVPFFLVNNLLLLNQIPDMEADSLVGRNHFVIAFGVGRAVFVYALFALLAALVIIAALFTQMLPWLASVSLLPMAMAMIVFRKLHSVPLDDPTSGDLHALLGMNVAITLLTPGLLALGLVFG